MKLVSYFEVVLERRLISVSTRRRCVVMRNGDSFRNHNFWFVVVIQVGTDFILYFLFDSHAWQGFGDIATRRRCVVESPGGNDYFSFIFIAKDDSFGINIYGVRRVKIMVIQ